MNIIDAAIISLLPPNSELKPITSSLPKGSQQKYELEFITLSLLWVLFGSNQDQVTLPGWRPTSDAAPRAPERPCGVLSATVNIY